jgi:hypothetical protein
MVLTTFSVTILPSDCLFLVVLRSADRICTYSVTPLAIQVKEDERKVELLTGRVVRAQEALSSPG